MEIARRSRFKNEKEDKQWFENWVSELEKLNQKKYSHIQIQTSIGITQVYGLNFEKKELPTLVIFPGARTTSLFFDLDNGLKPLESSFRILMVETNGLPNLSDGDTPDIKGLGYGEWASEVFDQLNISKAFIAGASFGGLICMKMSIVAPSRIKAIFLLNPGCLQPFSMSLKNLYYNLLPIIRPTPKNVIKFLDKAVLCKSEHYPSAAALKLLVNYEVFALKRYQDKTQKPYYMNDQLELVTSNTYLLEGDQDLLFPYKKSIKNAEAKIKGLKEVIVLKNVGHGIETYPQTAKILKEKMEALEKVSRTAGADFLL